MELAFRDITVTQGDRKVLHNISGRALGGQLMAIMGPSGAGKTLLLSVLTGRLPIDSGHILIDNTPLNRRLQRKMSYVLQQDIFFPNLTLMDTLTFAAHLRLPDEMSKADKMERVNDIVDILDLRKCLDTVMGGMWLPDWKGLSGGERKRANIACEILTDPSTILLDEPTTGLDSSTAGSLLTTLRGYAVKKKKTVVMSIHQPSTQNFFQFDKLLLLCEGKMAYYGQTDDVIEYFDNIGIPIPDSYNPADFILEKLKEQDETMKIIISAANEMRDWESYEPNSERTILSDRSCDKSDLSAVKTRKVFHNLFRQKIVESEEGRFLLCIFLKRLLTINS
ncbi:hypothetical protein ScPMuIL_015770 [Solemya velum]